MKKFYKCYYCETVIKKCYIDNLVDTEIEKIECPICKEEGTLIPYQK